MLFPGDGKKGTRFPLGIYEVKTPARPRARHGGSAARGVAPVPCTRDVLLEVGEAFIV